MKPVLFVCTLFAITYSTNGQAVCTTPDGETGVCKSIYDCPRLQILARETAKNPELIQKLIGLRCSDKHLQFCCAESDCYTPDGKKGVCKDVKECPHLMQMIRQSTDSDIYYLRHSQCNKLLSVCCGPPPTASVTTGGCRGQMSAFPPLPDSGCCGVDAVPKRRTFTDLAIEIYAHPWLVLLEYNTHNNIQLKCGGFLISGKYVLTTAYCVKTDKPINVRVGEFDKENVGPDCTNGECTDPAISMSIEEIIAHPEYNVGTKWNDIALIRLKEAVNYTDFVRPICLPYNDLHDDSNNSRAYLAGWGNNNYMSQSKLKRTSLIPLVNMENCANSYRRYIGGSSTSLWSRQICAGGGARQGCLVNGGSPLMSESRGIDKTMYEAIGVLSFGPSSCDSEGVPEVFTKVFDYISWIRSHIKP